MINWDILRHPLNWFTVVLMLILASFVLHLIMTAVMQAGNGSPYRTIPTVKEA